MTAIIEVYDRHGQFLDVMTQVDFGTRTWCLDIAGDFVFQMPRTHPKATRLNLSSMNLIVARSDLGVQPWGGRIDSVTWSDPTNLTVACKSKETILQRCVVDAKQKYSGMTAGAVIRDVVQRWGIDIPRNNKILKIGDIYDGGAPLGEEVDVTGDDVWSKTIPDMKALSGHDCWVDADGTFNWVERRGQDVSSTVVLRSGHHIVRATYVINFGPLITKAVAWSTDESSNAVYEDLAAQAKYGILATTIDAGEDTALSLEALAQIAVSANYEPEEKLDLYLVNREDVFSKFWIGDTVRVIIPQYGFSEYGGVDMYLRVGGIEVDEQAGTMRVVGAVDTTIIPKKKRIRDDGGGGDDDGDYEEFPEGDGGGYDPGGDTWGGFYWEWDDDYIGISDDGETYDDITPTTDPPNDCVDPINPTIADVTINNVISVDGVLYATAIWKNPLGNWRSWLVSSTDQGQSWTWSETLQPTPSESPPASISMLLAGELLWDIDSATWVGPHGDDDYAWGAINGYWSALSNAEATQEVTLPAQGEVTIWGNLKRNTCSSCGPFPPASPAGEYAGDVEINYGTLQIKWTAGQDGYKEASAVQTIGPHRYEVRMGFVNSGGSCYSCSSDTDGYGDVYDFGMAYTADIPAAPDPCDGTDISGGLDYDAEG